MSSCCLYYIIRECVYGPSRELLWDRVREGHRFPSHEYIQPKETNVIKLDLPRLFHSGGPPGHKPRFRNKPRTNQAATTSDGRFEGEIEKRQQMLPTHVAKAGQLELLSLFEISRETGIAACSPDNKEYILATFYRQTK